MLTQNFGAGEGGGGSSGKQGVSTMMANEQFHESACISKHASS